MPTLPIFPLGTVLTPGAELPLRIFEPRYLALIRDLLAQPAAERHFGIVALRRGTEVGTLAQIGLHDIGCAALVTSVSRMPGPAGQRLMLSVQTVGTRRFRLHGLDPTAPTPYHSGEVDWLDEPAGDTPEALVPAAARLRRGVAAYRSLIGAELADLPSDPTETSYAAPAQVVLDLGDRQAILESASTADRLRLGQQLVHRERILVSALGALPNPGPPPAPAPN